MIDRFSKLNLQDRLLLQEKIKAGDVVAIKEWTYFCLYNGLKKWVDKDDLDKFLSMIKIEVK